MKQKQWLARKLWMVIALFFLGGLTLCLPEQAKAAETDGYDVDLCEELRLLPGHQYDCNRHIDGYNLQENYEVDDVEIKDISSNREDIVMVDAWEDEDGWCIKAGDSFGDATLTVEYVIRDGERERNGSREIRVFVVSETWDVNVISDTGSDFLLPEASLSLTADVIRNCYDVDEGEEYQGDIASIEYDWKIADDNGNNFITISKGERENEITVAAKSLTGEAAEAGYAQEIVQLDILIDGKVVATFDYPVTIANEYYKINAKEINSGMEIGASDTIEPSLELYQLGKEPETVTEDIRYRWKWDTDAVDIVDGDSKPLTEDDSIGAPPFTITRKGDWGTDLFLYAEMWNKENEEWEDVASCYYWLEDLDYSIWIDWDKIGGRDYIYTDEPEVTIPFNTENINDKTCDVNWYVTVDGEEENDDPIHNLIEEGRAFVSEDGNGIIIDGTGLLDGEAPLEVGQSIRVSAKVFVGDEVICESDEIWLEVCEPWEEYDIPSDIYMLPKWDEWVSKTIGYHVNNGENPYGMDDEVQITKLTLITPNADEPSGEPVVEINDEDENGWNIHALTYGHDHRGRV